MPKLLACHHAVQDCCTRALADERCIFTDRYFTGNALVRAKSFLDEITLKTPGEKATFAAELRIALRRLRPAAVVRHLVRPLLSRVSLAEPSLADVVQDLLQPRKDDEGVLPEPEYRAAIVPRLLELYVTSLPFSLSPVLRLLS